MRMDKDNLADLVVIYMEDNDLEYLSIRASVAANGEDVKIAIVENLEYED